MTSVYRHKYVHDILIVFGGFVSAYISMGFAHSIGVLHTELLENFNSSRSDTSWIASLGSGTMLLFGPFAGIVEEKLGCRAIGVLGSFLIGVGMVASAFVNKLYILYVTFGIISGTGLCFSYVASSVVVNVYFEKKRGFATGVAMSGIGLCSITMPVLSRYLIDLYGWRGTFLILAGVGFQGLYCGLLFVSIRTSSTKTSKRICPTTRSVGRDTVWMKTKAILTSRKFMLFLFSSVVVSWVYFVPYVMLPDVVIQYGISKSDAAFMITIAGLTSTLCRILFGLLSDIPGWNNIIANGVALIILGITTGTIISFRREALFFIYSLILGSCTGIFGVYQTVIVTEIVGKNLMGLALGYMICMEGIAAIIGPPLAGLMFDLTENYQLSFICCGIAFCVGGILSILASMGNCKKGSYNLQ